MKKLFLIGLVAFTLGSVSAQSLSQLQIKDLKNNEIRYAKPSEPSQPDVIAPNPFAYDDYYKYYKNHRRFLAKGSNLLTTLASVYPPMQGNNVLYRSYGYVLPDIDYFPLRIIPRCEDYDLNSIYLNHLVYAATFDPHVIFNLNTYPTKADYAAICEHNSHWWESGYYDYDPFLYVYKNLIGDSYKTFIKSEDDGNNLEERLHDAVAMFAYFAAGIPIFGRMNPYENAFVSVLRDVSGITTTVSAIKKTEGSFFGLIKNAIDSCLPVVAYTESYNYLDDEEGAETCPAYLSIVGYARKVLRKDNELYYSYEAIYDDDFGNYVALEIDQLSELIICPWFDINNL